MSLSLRLSSLLPLLYKSINRTGVFNLEWAQAVFVSSYFAYKKYLEDANAKLVKNYPELFQGGHILDIGANIGYTSYVFSKVLTSPYKVFAFEPEGRNVKILKKAAKMHHFSDKLVITEAAVGEKEGLIDLWQNDGHHADHRILTEEFRKQLTGIIQVQKIPMITIDNFLKKQTTVQPVSFIKVDVQGYELAVCRGMEDTLISNPNCVVELEYCPSIMEALGYQGAELIQFFQEKKFLFYRINKNGTLDPLDLRVDNPVELSKDFQGYFDILCSRQNLII